MLLLASAAAPAQTIAVAQALLEPDGLPPVETQVVLPHRWDHAFPGRSGKATYRIELPPRNTAGVHGVYLPRVGNQVEVHMGQRLVFSAGKLGNSATDIAKPPVWIELQPDELSSWSSTMLTVTITAQASRWGGLTRPTFGPKAEIHPMYLERYRWRQYGGLAVTVAMGLMALVAAGVWWLQREPLYGVFALGASCGALRFGDRLITEPPLDWPLWGLVTAIAMIGYVGLMLRFALMLVNRERPWMRMAHLIGLTTLSGMATWAFVLAHPDVWTHALSLLLAAALGVWCLVVYVAWRERTTESILLGAAGLIAILAGLYDNIFVRRMGAGLEGFSLLPLASLVFVLLLGWVVVTRFARQTREHRELLATLNLRIHERERELDASHAQLREEHAHQATLLERQRIMRDIHDGVGAQLVGLLSLLNHSDTSAASLREQASAALDELRMAVDATQPVHGDLATVLATLRYRLQPRLEAAGIEIVWLVDELPRMEGLTPQVVLQLQRILLEAFTNVIRHAQASRLSVMARSSGTVDRPCLVLTVEDNGRGFDATRLPGAGQGMGNMRARAEAVGATLGVSRGDMGGTRLLLELPIKP